MDQQSTQTSIKTAKDANEAYITTLSDVISIKNEIQAEQSDSIGSGKKFKEIINYHFIISNPTQRLLSSKSRAFNLPGAIARFVWMMAANNRLADIEFYWGNKILPFTDDDFTIPGSSYGTRMFNASPGLDQIDAVINRLKEDTSTRRAAVSIYHPIDAIRKSNDIPCTFGLFYHIRDNKLVSTVMMRSNNAFILLPYNIFEFSLLAEIIAKQVGVEMGCMHYHALSMHIYNDHYKAVDSIIKNKNEVDDIAKFPLMPFAPDPMSEVKKLIRLEAKIRHVSAGINNLNIDEWLGDVISIGERDKDKIKLDEYWKQFYYLLLYYIVLKKSYDKEALQKVASLIQEPYKQYLEADDSKTMSKAVQKDLFGDLVGNPAYLTYSHVTQKLNSLESLCSKFNNQEIEKGSGRIIDFPKYLKLRNTLIGDMSEFQKIAARNDNPKISEQEFIQSLNELFGD